jgi:hypothetical protein
MIDAEVLRLRKLRNVALRARALANTLDSDSSEERSLFARSALICWTIARIASGRLRAHPYMSYQRGPSWLRKLADGLLASLVALSARRRDRRFSVYAQELRNVSCEVDDVRSLTWSADLSDALGRMQTQLGRLANEFELGALRETGGPVPQAKAMACEGGDSMGEIAAVSSWPYLAIQ